MTNPSDPNDFGDGDELGGMLRFLAFAPNNPPIIYFTVGGDPQGTVSGVPGPYDDADIYSWNGHGPWSPNRCH